MDLFGSLRNIYGKNNEEELVRAIGVVRETLKGLTLERTCKIYSSFLLRALRSRHVPGALISSLDLGADYEHQFVLVPTNSGGYYLADLTFSQFNCGISGFERLISGGYQEVSDEEFLTYLRIVVQGNFSKSVSLDDAFFATQVQAQDIRRFGK